MELLFGKVSPWVRQTCRTQPGPDTTRLIMFLCVIDNSNEPIIKLTDLAGKFFGLMVLHKRIGVMWQ
jgi:hypothetical protein